LAGAYTLSFDVTPAKVLTEVGARFGL